MLADLGSHVVRSSTERPGTILVVNVFLAHTEVSNFDVTVSVEQDVIQLQVPEHGQTSTATSTASGVRSTLR